MGGGTSDAIVTHGTCINNGTAIDTELDTVDVFAFQRNLTQGGQADISGLYVRANTNMPNTYMTNRITDHTNAVYSNYISVNGGEVTVSTEMTGSNKSISWCAIQFTS